MNKDEKEFLNDDKTGDIEEKWLKKRPRRWYKFWSRGNETPVEEEEIKDNGIMMLYIDEDKKGKIITNVRSGNYDDGNFFQRKKAYNKVMTSKAIEVDYEGYSFPLVIQYKREFLPYPYEPKYDNETIANVIENIRLNYENFDKNRDSFGKMDLWLGVKIFGAVVGIIIGAIWAYYVFIAPEIDKRQAIETAKTVAPVVKEVVNQTINGSVKLN